MVAIKIEEFDIRMSEVGGGGSKLFTECCRNRIEIGLQSNLKIFFGIEVAWSAVVLDLSSNLERRRQSLNLSRNDGLVPFSKICWVVFDS